jgi:hypothetical protein
MGRYPPLDLPVSPRRLQVLADKGPAPADRAVAVLREQAEHGEGARPGTELGICAAENTARGIQL